MAQNPPTGVVCSAGVEEACCCLVSLIQLPVTAIGTLKVALRSRTALNPLMTLATLGGAAHRPDRLEACAPPSKEAHSRSAGHRLPIVRALVQPDVTVTTLQYQVWLNECTGWSYSRATCLPVRTFAVASAFTDAPERRAAAAAAAGSAGSGHTRGRSARWWRRVRRHAALPAQHLHRRGHDAAHEVRDGRVYEQADRRDPLLAAGVHAGDGGLDGGAAAVALLADACGERDGQRLLHHVLRGHRGWTLRRVRRLSICHPHSARALSLSSVLVLTHAPPRRYYNPVQYTFRPAGEALAGAPANAELCTGPDRSHASHFAACAAEVLDGTAATCTGVPSPTCDLDIATDGSGACPVGCTHVDVGVITAAATCTGTQTSDNLDCAAPTAWSTGDQSASTCGTSGGCTYAAATTATVATCTGTAAPCVHLAEDARAFDRYSPFTLGQSPVVTASDTTHCTLTTGDGDYDAATPGSCASVDRAAATCAYIAGVYTLPSTVGTADSCTSTTVVASSVGGNTKELSATCIGGVRHGGVNDRSCMTSCVGTADGAGVPCALRSATCTGTQTDDTADCAGQFYTVIKPFFDKKSRFFP